MNKFILSKLGDTLTTGGFALLLANIFGFWITAPETGLIKGDTGLSPFMMSYASAIIFFVATRLSSHKHYKTTRYTTLLLILMVSCFSLNRELNVFHESATWVSILLGITSAALLLFHFWDGLSIWVKYVITFILGIGFTLWFYYALYLIPLYVISIPLMIILGVSIHTFVPALFVLHTIYLIRKTVLQVRHGLKYFLSGITAAILVVIIYSMMYSSEVSHLNRIYNRTAAEGNANLPTWIEALQRADRRFMEDKVLKSSLAYLAYDFNRIAPFSAFNMSSFNEAKRYHDPLVLVSATVAPRILAPEEDRVRILASLHSRRHDALERFWRGQDLYTQYVNTRVRLWPEFHLAYTEKMLTVSNRGRSTEEAIYTFHMPEGAVVTSLSLWINGIEEKAVLTTKEKADSAYRTIVGKEMRDPSLVKWQEGNTVSVRVFPVEGLESRQFRIGFTAPLTKDENNQLRYDNIYFEGPSADGSPEDVTIKVEGQPERTESRSYKEDWNLRMQDKPVKTSAFSFNGYAYTLQPYTPERETVRTDKIYLDVNSSWSVKQIDEVLALAGSRPVYVWLRDEMIRMEKDNKAACIRYLRQLRFSMFPIHEITDPGHALFITRNNPESPSLDDIKGSSFHKQLSAWLAKPDQPKLRMLNMGSDLSHYLKSLKEFRAFRYEQGGTLLLKVLLDNNSFAKDTENEHRIVIDQAGLAITKQPVDTLHPSPDTAPDHLLRLFNYNHIMQQAGKGLITGSAGQDSLVAAAKEAYVVSPLSSLIVLETQRDYDRFDIHDNGNSLKNASFKSKGAVPEPHEWALIILVLLTLLYLKFRNQLWNSTVKA